MIGVGSDVQVSGVIVMYIFECDLCFVGNGFGGIVFILFNCMVIVYDVVCGGNFNFFLLLVQIIDGVVGVFDQIIILYGEVDVVVLLLIFNVLVIDSKSLDSNSGSLCGGIMMGDVMIVVSGILCGLIEVIDNINSDVCSIVYGQGSYI